MTGLQVSTIICVLLLVLFSYIDYTSFKKNGLCRLTIFQLVLYVIQVVSVIFLILSII